MSYSLPLIVTDVGDNNHLVQNDDNGFVVEPKDSLSITKYLELLLSNHILRIEYGISSYKTARENYSLENMKNRYLELIETLSNG